MILTFICCAQLVLIIKQENEAGENHWDENNYGMVVSMPLADYPTDDLQLARFVSDYPSVAKALFLMNDDQLIRFVSRLPEHQYDETSPALQGISFVSQKTGESRPYLFGTREESDREGHNYKFFGVTTVEYVPLLSFPIHIGKLRRFLLENR